MLFCPVNGCKGGCCTRPGLLAALRSGMAAALCAAALPWVLPGGHGKVLLSISGCKGLPPRGSPLHPYQRPYCWRAGSGFGTGAACATALTPTAAQGRGNPAPAPLRLRH